jgi:hypothetical protein
MKHVKYKVDIEGIGNETLDLIQSMVVEHLTKQVQAVAAEAIQNALESSCTSGYFPVSYGDDDGMHGDAVEDPLTVYLCIDIGDPDRQPTYSFSLRDFAECTLWDANGEYYDGLGRLSAALREFADEIDEARSMGAKTE